MDTHRKKLFMADDLSGDQIMFRAPIWDWMLDENSTLEFDTKFDSYIYYFDCYINEKHRRISLAVPPKFFTQDMLEAYDSPRELLDISTKSRSPQIGGFILQIIKNPFPILQFYVSTIKKATLGAGMVLMT